VLLVYIFNFNFNVEVGETSTSTLKSEGKRLFLKSVTLRTLVAFFEIVIPDPWSSFSVVEYNQLTGFFYSHHLKRPGASEDSKPRLGKKGRQSPFRALSGVS